jgi:hypothetical protein
VDDFRRHYGPTCRSLAADNRIGHLIFAATRQIQRRRMARRAVLRMAADEQRQPPEERRLSGVLWDTFTGSAPYRDILQRALHPAFWGRMLWYLGLSLLRPAMAG